jgi:hypothetical protein
LDHASRIWKHVDPESGVEDAIATSVTRVIKSILSRSQRMEYPSLASAAELLQLSALNVDQSCRETDARRISVLVGPQRWGSDDLQRHRKSPLSPYCGRLEQTFQRNGCILFRRQPLLFRIPGWLSSSSLSNPPTAQIFS